MPALCSFNVLPRSSLFVSSPLPSFFELRRRLVSKLPWTDSFLIRSALSSFFSLVSCHRCISYHAHIFLVFFIAQGTPPRFPFHPVSTMAKEGPTHTIYLSNLFLFFALLLLSGFAALSSSLNLFLRASRSLTLTGKISVALLSTDVGVVLEREDSARARARCLRIRGAGFWLGMVDVEMGKEHDSEAA